MKSLSKCINIFIRLAHRKSQRSNGHILPQSLFYVLLKSLSLTCSTEYGKLMSCRYFLPFVCKEKQETLVFSSFFFSQKHRKRKFSRYNYTLLLAQGPCNELHSVEPSFHKRKRFLYIFCVLILFSQLLYSNA